MRRLFSETPITWNGPILTDNGVYQIFSLAKLRKITEEGVEFQNHIDGARAFLSLEIAIEIQAALACCVIKTPCTLTKCDCAKTNAVLNQITRKLGLSKFANWVSCFSHIRVLEMENSTKEAISIMKPKEIFIGILAVLFVCPLMGTFAQQAPNSDFIEVV